MTLYLYSLKDAKVGQYMSLFELVNDNVAVRTFRVALNDPNTPYHDYPADIDLYRIGKYDTDTGVVTPDLEFLANGAAIVNGGETYDVSEFVQ